MRQSVRLRCDVRPLVPGRRDVGRRADAPSRTPGGLACRRRSAAESLRAEFLVEAVLLEIVLLEGALLEVALLEEVLLEEVRWAGLPVDEPVFGDRDPDAALGTGRGRPVDVRRR